MYVHSSEIRGFAESFATAKCFKICYILYERKPIITLSVFHFVLLYFSPNECPGYSLGEKIK